MMMMSGYLGGDLLEFVGIQPGEFILNKTQCYKNARFCCHERARITCTIRIGGGDGSGSGGGQKEMTIHNHITILHWLVRMDGIETE